MRPPRLPLRHLLGIASQAISSVSNLLLAVVVAREVSSREFGAWGIGYALLILLLSVSRALVSTPVLVRQDYRSRDVANTSGLALALGFGAFACASSLAPIMPTGLGATLIAFGAIAPGVLWHDNLRYVGIRERRMGRVVTLDVAVLLGQLGLLTIWHFLGGPLNVASLVAGWGAPCALVAIVFTIKIRILPTLTGAWRYLSADGRLAATFLTDTLIVSVLTAALPAGLALALGLEMAGLFRGGQTVIGVVGVVVAGTIPLITADTKTLRRSGRSVNWVIIRWSLLIAAISAAYGIALLLIPQRLGGALLGETWALLVPYLWFFILHACLRGPYTVVPALLRGTRQGALLLDYRIRSSIAVTLCPLGGAMLFGLLGALYGLVLGAVWANIQAIFVAKRIQLQE